MTDIKETAALMVSGRMLQIMPLIIWSAWSLNFFAAVFIILMVRCMKQSHPDCKILPDAPDCWDDDKRNETALFAMTLLGAGEILGGTIIGWVRDKTGNRIAIISEILLLLIGFAFVIVLNAQNKFGPFAYVMTFMWGIQDSGLNCLINCILGFEFDSKIAPFGVYKFS